MMSLLPTHAFIMFASCYSRYCYCDSCCYHYSYYYCCHWVRWSVVVKLFSNPLISLTSCFWLLCFPSIHSVTTLKMRVIRKLHLVLLYPAEMATHSKMFSFDPNKEQRTSYTERLDFYFETNNFTSAGTKRTILVSGPSTFQLLKSLLQPSTPKERSILN